MAKGRSNPDFHSLVEGDVAGPSELGSDLLERAQQKGARGGKPCLGLGDLRLDQVVVAQRPSERNRTLSRANSTKTSSVLRAIPIATPANPAA